MPSSTASLTGGPDPDPHSGALGAHQTPRSGCAASLCGDIALTYHATSIDQCLPCHAPEAWVRSRPTSRRQSRITVQQLPSLSGFAFSTGKGAPNRAAARLDDSGGTPSATRTIRRGHNADESRRVATVSRHRHHMTQPSRPACGRSSPRSRPGTFPAAHVAARHEDTAALSGKQLRHPGTRRITGRRSRHRRRRCCHCRQHPAGRREAPSRNGAQLVEHGATTTLTDSVWSSRSSPPRP